MKHFALLLPLGLAPGLSAQSGLLLVGQEGDGIPLKTASLTAFPAVSYVDGADLFVQGAAATPDSLIYVCDGTFTNDLYSMRLGESPALLARLSVSGIYGLGYVGGKLYGFSNFGTPMGIYEIDPTSGACTLRRSTEAEGLRFFALDGNASDGLLYGFSEYGTSGLWSIDPATWTLHRVAATPPGSYGMCRGMAVGNHTVYMVDTHPTDTYYAYDLAQGDNGVYVPFQNPYPESRNGGGAWHPPIAEAVPYNGSGLNPLLYLSTTRPTLGTTWRAEIDTLGLSFVTSTWIFGHVAPRTGVFLGVGELLIDPRSTRLFRSVAPASGGPSLHANPIPNLPALSGLTVWSQGLLLGPGPLMLTNGMELRLR